MTLIAINGIIKERVDSTANWSYVNPVLAIKEKGFEVADLTTRIPVGMKIGDGVKSWNDLPYWFGGGPSSVVKGMGAAGTANPIVVPFTYGTNPKVSVVVALSTDGTNKTLTNRQVTLAYDLVFTDSTKTTLVSVNIWGNDNGGVLNEDTYYSIQG